MTNVAPVNPKALFRIETYSDLVAGEISVFIPVTTSGDTDPSRELSFRGTTQLSAPGRPPIRLQFPLPGTSLSEALEGWQAAVAEAIAQIQSQAIKQTILGAGQAPANAPKIITD